MRGIIAALVGFALHVNTQFALNVGPPSVHLQMFGKDLINVGNKKRHHKRKGKAHRRKNNKKHAKKPVKPIQPKNNGDSIVDNSLLNEEGQKIMEHQIEIGDDIVDNTDAIEELQQQNLIDVDEKIQDQTDEQETNLDLLNPLTEEVTAEQNKVEQINEEEAKNNEENENQNETDPNTEDQKMIMINQESSNKPEQVVLLIRGAPMINLSTAETLDAPKEQNIEQQDEQNIETQSQMERRMQDEENERLAKMIKFMPEAEKKHLRAMASNRAQY